MVAGPGDADARTRARVADVRTRVLSAVLLAPVVLALAWLGGWPFAVLVALASAILVSEWSGVSRAVFFDAAVAASAAGAAGAVVVMAAGFPAAAFGVLAFAAVCGQFLARDTDPARLIAVGTFYAGLPAMALLLLREDPAFGLAAAIWLLLVVWATDIGGYAFGRAIGGPKLAPRISPKKTWAGFLGGVLAAIAADWIWGWSLPETAVPMIVAAIVSVASQAGDLGESAFKRRFGAKDSGWLIPGHGGLMDRVDGLLAATIVAACIGVARGGPGSAGAGLMVW